jgi:hypothetical protein
MTHKTRTLIDRAPWGLAAILCLATLGGCAKSGGPGAVSSWRPAFLSWGAKQEASVSDGEEVPPEEVAVHSPRSNTFVSPPFSD